MYQTKCPIIVEVGEGEHLEALAGSNPLDAINHTPDCLQITINEALNSAKAFVCHPRRVGVVGDVAVELCQVISFWL